MIALALAALAAVLLAASLPLWRRRGGTQRASFDPVALEDAVYGELYGDRTIRVLSAVQDDSAGAEQDGSATGGRGPPAARGGPRICAPQSPPPRPTHTGHQ